METINDKKLLRGKEKQKPERKEILIESRNGLYNIKEVVKHLSPSLTSPETIDIPPPTEKKIKSPSNVEIHYHYTSIENTKKQ